MNNPDVSKFRNLSDAEWVATVIKSIEQPVIEGVTFPAFPPAEVQTNYVGRANEAALNDALTFYEFLKEFAREVGCPINPDSTVVDFGCGWGRYLRLLWRDVNFENLHGVDVSKSVLAICSETRIPAQLHNIEPMGTLPFDDASVDNLMAYSVFSHLAEEPHLHWMNEFKRVIRPDGTAVITLRSRNFLESVHSLKDMDVTGNRHLTVMKPFADIAVELMAEFDAGRFAYIPSCESDPRIGASYGDCSVPKAYIENHWAPEFKICHFIEDGNRFRQTVVGLQRL